MNIIVTILIVIAAIIALLLIAALFIKNTYVVERSLIIQKPLMEVWNYVKYLKNQDYYSKWVMTDPQLKQQYRGTDATVGFSVAWDSDIKQVGKGEQEITKITDGERIDYEVRFEKPFKGIAGTFMLTDAINAGQTKVTWGMTGKSPYPMNIMCLFMPEMLGKDMAESLTTLKGNLEKQ